jgi:hypothetical protein
VWIEWLETDARTPSCPKNPRVRNPTSQPATGHNTGAVPQLGTILGKYRNWAQYWGSTTTGHNTGAVPQLGTILGQYHNWAQYWGSTATGHSTGPVQLGTILGQYHNWAQYWGSTTTGHNTGAVPQLSHAYFVILPTTKNSNETSVLWNGTPCKLVKSYKRFGKASILKGASETMETS